MCGVVSIIYARDNRDLGKEAASLLKKLEYRGYDSTGAAFCNSSGAVVLRKKVGAPTKVIEELEIEKFGGSKFIGQVRWATYGAVTDENAQPHEMNCRLHLVGAHNGNISNTDLLKEFLRENLHHVISDNDGEMLVHTVEHYLADELATVPDVVGEGTIEAMKRAIRRMHKKVQGSYAACLTMPENSGIFAIKAGSSLYAGKGSDSNGDFIVVSSDLTSVLSKTRFLIPLSEGQGLYFTHDTYQVFDLNSDQQSVPGLTRSRLNIADITLHSKYDYFMQQEIYSASDNLGPLLHYYFQDNSEDKCFTVFEEHREICKSFVFELLKLYEVFDTETLRNVLEKLFGSADFQNILSRVRPYFECFDCTQNVPRFLSDEQQLLRELLYLDDNFFEGLFLLDLILIWKKKRMILNYKNNLLSMMKDCNTEGNRIFAIGAGTSYHAALVAAYFFNSMSDTSLFAANPGMFRSMYIKGLKKGDLIIGITQSGETKDLLDIFNDVRQKYGDSISIVSLVNNENSTIPQEKSDFYLPILCGPEIAVAATKSFISQITLFYLLAASLKHPSAMVKKHLKQIQSLLDITLQNCEEDVSEVALKFFLKPSMHILGTSLIGLAREGSLKIREVVLNHTEGYDSAEFKHGPNTILGKNTIFSLEMMEKLLKQTTFFMKGMLENLTIDSKEQREQLIDCLHMIHALKFKEYRHHSRMLSNNETHQTALFENCMEQFKNSISLENYFDNYPLIVVCPPDTRDKQITITQIHTHKIRGADVILIAQEDDDLRKALEGKPAVLESYFTKYIKIPKMFDPDLFVFGATIVLQLLAFRMSVAKMKYLNRNHVEKHGVHPDVPKNVSKSITVD